MVYIRINDVIRNVITVNFEGKKYELLSRLFWQPNMHLMLQMQKKSLGHAIQFICFHLHYSEYRLFVSICITRIILKRKHLKFGGGDEAGGFVSKENYPGGHHPVHLRLMVGITIQLEGDGLHFMHRLPSPLQYCVENSDK